MPWPGGGGGGVRGGGHASPEVFVKSALSLFATMKIYFLEQGRRRGVPQKGQENGLLGGWLYQLPS